MVEVGDHHVLGGERGGEGREDVWRLTVQCTGDPLLSSQ